MSIKGLTWDHPRGYAALKAAAAALDPERDGIGLTWDIHPLEGFESAPIDDLCARYDLVVLDHPHLGEAVARGSLTPLEVVFPAADLDAVRAATVGRCFESYCYDGRHWALPLDAATQVMAALPGQSDRPLPRLWEEVRDLSHKGGVALPLAGPHAFLSFLSIVAAHGGYPARDPDQLAEREAASAALDIMADLAARMPQSARPLNPIGLLEALSRGTDFWLVPLVYGYVNYAVASHGRRAVIFADAPRAAPDGPPGTTLGGTGIGVSSRCTPGPALRRHLLWLMSEDAQRRFIPHHEGQPSRREAWKDPAVDRLWGGFYGATMKSIEAAVVRPRHDGFIAFQTEASALIREGLEAGAAPAALLERIEAGYRRSLK